MPSLIVLDLWKCINFKFLGLKQESGLRVVAASVVRPTC